MPADDSKAPVQIAVYCDRCEAQLVVDGDTREEAHAKLHALIIEKGWRVTDRLSRADEAEAFGETTPVMRGPQDLCGDCVAKQ